VNLKAFFFELNVAFLRKKLCLFKAPKLRAFISLQEHSAHQMGVLSHADKTTEKKEKLHF
jgi:hypothetical protein